MDPKEYLEMCRKESPPQMLEDARVFAAMSHKDQNEFLYFLMMDTINRVKFYHEEVRKSGN